MVTLVNHGGHCCGARHLHNFGLPENTNPNLINVALGLAPDGCQVEVILNHPQVASLPNVVRRLSDLGFVLQGSFRNDNHNTRCYSFMRAGRRESLNDADWWPGMFASRDLSGDLPRLVQQAQEPVVRPRHRHENDPNPPIRGVTVPAGPVPAPVVAQLYSNVYRTLGRSAFRFGTFNGAGERGGGRVSVDRLDIYSDGRQVWVEGVTE